VSRISQSQLESYLWGAAEHLRGSIDAGDYKQFIFPLLFLKRLCDVHDEETAQALRASGGDAEFASFAENHRFQVPADAHWKEIRKETRNVGQAIQRSMRAIESANKDKLFGIFGDAQWTNKDRLSDETMRELIEHFSSLELTIANLPEDELGQGYEFLIKKFADDSGHTAAEFYTNRTVVHLMTEMLDVQPGESVYDPTCGSGGMLMSCVAHLRKQGKEWRNVRLFGQERNLMTSSIARMNCFLHGIEDFRIERGDTLAEPKLVEGDKLMQFDVVLANPPYSIKQWDREAFRSDPWGRNLFGVPPQGRADYTFQQHIIKSLKPKTGRSVALWPHGLLSREEEGDIREKLIAADLVEAVIGLGRKLFYNSGMESCLLVCRTSKPKSRRGKVLFIDVEQEIEIERGQAFLSKSNISNIHKAYRSDVDISGVSRLVPNAEILTNKGNLNIKLYINGGTSVAQTPAAEQALAREDESLQARIKDWIGSSQATAEALKEILPELSLRQKLKLGSVDVAKSFDRSKWRKVRLGDVASESAERVDNPAESGYDRYVGSDCIDRHDFRVTRWDPAASVTSSMKAFKLGDYLLVRRSLYGSDFRERAPRANFAGLCSADILTVRENPALISDGFLIAILYRPALWAYIVAHAKGSLTRRIKWRELANYEFDLPPLDQQRRIAEILWAVDSLKMKVGEIALAARLLKASQIRQDTQCEKGMKLPLAVSLREVARIIGGAAFPHIHQGAGSGKIPFYKVSDMNRDGNEVYMSQSANYISEATRLKLGAKLVPEGAVIFPKVGAALLTNKRRITGGSCCIDNNLMAVVPVKVPVDLLYEHLCSIDFASIVQPGALPSINQSQIECLPIPFLTSEELSIFSRNNNSINSVIAAYGEYIRNCRSTQNILINSIT
jgi:type I restriction enzyme M protein